MTRFARAKGSKSCNEKAPEDSTPWEVMKEQLLNSKNESAEANNRREAENLRIQNYENFLKEQKTQKRKATWCDFPESEENKKKTIEASAPKKKKNKRQLSENTSELTEDNSKSEILDTNSSINKKQKKKKSKKNATGVPENDSTKELSQNRSINEAADNLKNNGLDKKKKKAKNTLNSQATESGQERVNNGSPTSKINSSAHQKLAAGKKNKKKFESGKQVRRKEVNDNTFKLIINGKDVDLVRFEGFPIMKRDAERIQELKTSMIKKGIPKSEVQRTIKLERRRAEKAVARLKRDVCYNCRKGGHNLSDCPDLKSKVPGSEVPDGVCFKCGSTEHRQFECKVQRDKEFRFATCFICKEAGHIARQCPDNPKGLYPNGGSCKLCGDVTHLRKDCPTVNEKKEETSIKLPTLDSADNIEDIGKLGKATQGDTTGTTSKKPKKIKF